MLTLDRRSTAIRLQCTIRHAKVADFEENERVMVVAQAKRRYENAKAGGQSSSGSVEQERRHAAEDEHVVHLQKEAVRM
eukprot:CAMPEP_0202831892 /NCGR_PEP_ID=MMETSP1389-20130828/17114_1 /ASSEMBLY_ACC=CAM_ASM_000865 /TAXON_ID=302021 /ORGANISM="Rhodomonas sp., Strain CCMP768" /LENGTH=78 /DNA_ID=CAMNT_0049505669 /DNA_START=168 /DNA_END=401 /DNA_ORIENTATION=+